MKQGVSIILIAVVGFSVYLNSINGKFIWDDENLIKNNIYVKGQSKILDIFTTDIGAGSGFTYHFYRPLQILTYRIDHSFWKGDVRGYHFTNILLHILAALSIYWLIQIICNDKAVSLLTSILFVTHPAHVEACAWISGRPEILALLFMLISFIFYVKEASNKNIFLFILMLLSYACALLSKENSLIFPILLLSYHYIFKKEIRLKKLLSIFAVLSIYIAIRILILRSSPIHCLDLAAFSKGVPKFFASIPYYLRILVFPFNLHMDYGNDFFNITDPRVLLGLILTLSLLIYAFAKRRNDNIISFSIIWFFAALLPVSNIYPLFSYVGERYLYLPSLGFFLILAKGLSNLYSIKRFRLFAMILVIGLPVFYSSLTIRQNNYWREPLAFYERTVKFAPNSVAVNDNLGIVYSEMGNKDGAMKLYKKAIAIDPTYARAYNNLGNIYHDKGDYDKAARLYKKAIALNPNYADAYYNLGNTYKNLHRYEESIISYKKAIALNPNHARAYNNLGGVYQIIGKYGEAILYYKKAVSIDPELFHKN